MKGSNKDYEKSNKIEIVALNRFSKTEYQKLLSDGNRLKDAQNATGNGKEKQKKQ